MQGGISVSASNLSQLSTGLLLPDAVHRILEEGQALRWDIATSCYEVVDGELFERRFDELRRKRDRDDGSNGRPFSRMHKYYKLQSGERWAKTGARFSPKDPLLLRRIQAQMTTPNQSMTGNPNIESHETNADIQNSDALATSMMTMQSFDVAHGIFGETSADSSEFASDLSSLSPQNVPEPYEMQEQAFQAMQNFQQQQQQQQPGLAPSQTVGMVGEEAHTGFKRSRQEGGDAMRQQTGGVVVRGDDVMVKLRNRGRMPAMADTFEVSLQTFFDTIDAGGRYIAAQAGGQQQEDAGMLKAGDGREGYPQTQSPDSVFSSSSAETEAVLSSEASPLHQAAPAALSEQLAPPSYRTLPTGLTVNTMGANGMQMDTDMLHMLPLPSPAAGMTPVGAHVWSQYSRGDQAYFFYRPVDQAPFSNGSVVALINGQLVPADDVSKAELLMVVSDQNALWKGEPHPPPEHEEQGHWCAFLGQVPMWVDGAVKAGEYLGPVGDGSGMAKVVKPGQEPAVAIALESKGSELTALKCLVSVGLNALNAQAADKELAIQANEKLVARLNDASAAVERVSGLAAAANRAAKIAKATATAAMLAAERSEVGVSHLSTRVHGLEDEVRDNRQLLEDLHVERPPSISRRQYLWSCFCGLFSIKVTETAGPVLRGKGKATIGEEEMEMAGQRYEPLPTGPEEEATCSSSCNSLSSAGMNLRLSRDDIGPLARKMMVWQFSVGEAIVTDTTINLALTCILMRVSHAAGINLSMKGVLHDCVESAIHILTLAYLVMPAFAVVSRMVSFARASKQAARYRQYMCAGGAEQETAAPSLSLLKRQLYAYEYVLNDQHGKADQQNLTCADVKDAMDRLCPCSNLKMSKHKFNLLIFWYAVAGYIAYASVQSSSVVAPFGYWYMIVQTLRMMYSMASRQAGVPPSGEAKASVHKDPSV